MPEKICPKCYQRVWVDNEDDEIGMCFSDGTHTTLRELETNVLSHYGVKQRVRVAKASTDIFHGEEKIVTDRCRHCPMLEGRYAPNTKTYYVCTHPDTDGWEIEHLDLIPLWCTLEDN